MEQFVVCCVCIYTVKIWRMRLTIITFLLMRISNFLLCVRGGVSPDISAGIEGVWCERCRARHGCGRPPPVSCCSVLDDTGRGRYDSCLKSAVSYHLWLQVMLSV